MSLLKKLFHFGSQNQRGKPRVKISQLHKISFRKLENPDKPIYLSSISTLGMGLLKRDTSLPKVGDHLSGQLDIEKDTFEVSCEVRHVSANIIGCQFAGPPSPLVHAIENYFKLEITGLELRPVTETVFKEDPRGQVKWFTDGKENEIYFVVDRKGILDFHLTFLGNYIEGGRNLTLKAGLIGDDFEVTDPSFRMEHKKAQLLNLQKPDRRILTMASSLLLNTQALPQEFQAELLGLLKQG